jgi:alpha-tubulin suppressor-like RCC1 family protein
MRWSEIDRDGATDGGGADSDWTLRREDLYDRRVKTRSLWVVILALDVGCSGSATPVRSAATRPSDAGSLAEAREATTGDASTSEPSSDGGSATGSPARPQEPPFPVSITMGEWHGCAVMSDGALRCWGRNREAQLGRPATATAPFTSTPTLVPGITGVVSQASAGTFHTCARTEEGRVFCWGDNRTGQSGVQSSPTIDRPTELRGVTEAVEITTGRDQSCARHRDGTVRCWGNNENGQLGDGSVRAPFAPTLVAGLRGVAEIAAGSGHTCARLTDGTVRCWGLNRRGQVGDRTRLTRHRPTAVVGVAHAAQIAVGREHGCARLEDGTVRCWGRNDVGQLGGGGALGSNVAVPVRGLTGVRQIAAGGLHTCAVLEDATVRCWGSNHHGQLGQARVGGVWRQPTPVVGLTGVESLALSRGADDGASCALRRDHSVLCWGDDAFGQLGRPSSGADPVASPVRWEAAPTEPASAPR